jgi:hypothetical protein
MEVFFSGHGNEEGGEARFRGIDSLGEGKKTKLYRVHKIN